MIRFHLDEHIHPGIAVGLRARGVDVTTTAEVGLLGAVDPEHIAFASGEERVIVTHDDDYLRLCAEGVGHAGLAYCHYDKYSIGEHLDMLLTLHGCLAAEEMRGQIQYL